MASPAHNLEHAFNLLDPRRAVTPEQVPTLFVERPFSPTAAIRVQLRVSSQPLKLLFVGHRGAGKSSELAYLSSLLGPKFLCISIPLWTIYGGPSVNHTEVLVAMTLRLLRAATDENIVSPGVINQVWKDWFEKPYRSLKEWLVGPFTADQAPDVTEFTLKVKYLAAEFESKVGVEPKTREQVKGLLQNRLNEVLQQIDELVDLLRVKLDRRVVLMVEDLDKFNLQDTEDLFLYHATTLTSPKAHVIYSFPVSMRYTGEFHQICQAFDEPHFLANVALKHRDGSSDQEGVVMMREVLLRRVSPELFDEGVVARTVALSGGHVRTLIQLAQRSVRNALVDDSARVGDRHLTKAASELRDDFITFLTRDQIKLLSQHHDDPEKDLSDMRADRQALLYNGSLLEYRNTRGPWGDVNPIVSEILERDGK